MMIQLKCTCGASAEFHDEGRGSYINGGGRPDSKGRCFQVEKMADDWLERHMECLNLKPQGGNDADD
jgi:hypothetical protein